MSPRRGVLTVAAVSAATFGLTLAAGEYFADTPGEVMAEQAQLAACKARPNTLEINHQQVRCGDMVLKITGVDGEGKVQIDFSKQEDELADKLHDAKNFEWEDTVKAFAGGISAAVIAAACVSPKIRSSVVNHLSR